MLIVLITLGGCGTPEQTAGSATTVAHTPAPVQSTTTLAPTARPATAAVATAVPPTLIAEQPAYPVALSPTIASVATPLPTVVVLPAPTPVIAPPLPASERRIVFASSHEGQGDLYLVRADGTNLTRLTQTVEVESAPAWSPDAAWVVFEVTSQEGRRSNLYKIRPDGSQQTRLTDGPVIDQLPAWSWDGQKIAFVSNAHADPNSKESNPSQLYQINADGGDRVPLDPLNPATVDTFLFASVNGPRLFETRLLAQPQGGWSDLARQMDDLFRFSGISWAPDRQRITYATRRDGNLEIYIIQADGSGRTRLTDDPAEDAFPIWSPDGQSIAFVSTVQGGTGGIDLMSADGSERTRVVEDMAAQSLAWSPDGQYLAYISGPAIVVIGKDGHEIARIPAVMVSFAWAPG